MRLRVLQVVLGLYFIGFGVLHFIVPEGLPSLLGWMYDLSPELHVLAGGAEILGGLVLVVSAGNMLNRRLGALAAFGLAAVMVGAMIFHAGRGEYVNIGVNVLLGALLVWVGTVRWTPEASPA